MGHDIDAAALLVEVVEQGSFRAAARRLELPKSTVSRRIAALEERLGARLLQRTTRRVALTDVGAAYFERARVAVAALAEAERSVSQLQATPRGTLKVTMPINFGFELGWTLIAAYLERCPEVSVVLDLSDRHVDLVAEGFDVAVRAGPLVDSSLIAQRLASTAFGLFASPGYLARRGRPATPAALTEHDCICRERSELWSFAGARKAGQKVRVHGRVAANSAEVRRDAAVAGYGIARLPRPLVDGALRAGRLEALLERYRLPAAPMHVVYPGGGRQLSPKVRAFVELLRSRAPASADEDWPEMRWRP
jgi:DNA-binding transcriptional LysR family regulator